MKDSIALNIIAKFSITIFVLCVAASNSMADGEYDYKQAAAKTQKNATVQIAYKDAAGNMLIGIN